LCQTLFLAIPILAHDNNAQEEMGLQSAGKAGFEARRQGQRAELAAVDAEAAELKRLEKQVCHHVLKPTPPHSCTLTNDQQPPPSSGK
jgi:hypothetical protein